MIFLLYSHNGVIAILEPPSDNAQCGHPDKSDRFVTDRVIYFYFYFFNNYTASKEIITLEEKTYCIKAMFMLIQRVHGGVIPVQQQYSHPAEILLDDVPKQASLGIWHFSFLLNRIELLAGIELSVLLSWWFPFSIPWSDILDTWKENFNG